MKFVPTIFLLCFLILFSCKKDEEVLPILLNYTAVIQPDSIDGQDAIVNSLFAISNAGWHPNISIGSDYISVSRSLIRFDFSSIPTNAIVDSVKLSLYTPSFPSDVSRKYSDDIFLQKLDNAWVENEVTWNNQPPSSETNQVILKTDGSTDYTNIDVTEISKGMIRDPRSNHGFIMKLEDESLGFGTNSQTFASSDHPDPTIHPKIVVHYSIEE